MAFSALGRSVAVREITDVRANGVRAYNDFTSEELMVRETHVHVPCRIHRFYNTDMFA